jgi:hypothetical protein
MAVTKKSDLFIPEILEEAIQGAFAGMNALFGTDAVIIKPTLGSTQKGAKVQIPYFGNLGEMEDLATDEGGAGAVPALTPAKLTSAEEEAIVQHSGKAFEITEWAEMSVSYADPYAEAADQIVRLVGRRADLALIAAAATTPLSIDAITDPALADTISWDAVVRTKGLFGDELEAQNGISLGVAHSKVMTDAELLKDTQNRPLLVNPTDGTLSRIGNIPFGRSDRLEITPATAPKTYNTLIAKPRSLVFWYNGNVQVQTDKDILADSKVAAIHVYWAVHRYTRMPGGTKPGVAKLITQ